MKKTLDNKIRYGIIDIVNKEKEKERQRRKVIKMKLLEKLETINGVKKVTDKGLSINEMLNGVSEALGNFMMWGTMANLTKDLKKVGIEIKSGKQLAEESGNPTILNRYEKRELVENVLRDVIDSLGSLLLM